MLSGAGTVAKTVPRGVEASLPQAELSLPMTYSQ